MSKLRKQTAPKKGNFHVQLPVDLRPAIERIAADRAKKGIPHGLNHITLEALRWFVAILEVGLCEQCERTLTSYNGAADGAGEPASIKMSLQHELAHFFLRRRQP
jgi:hypothetical protein